MTPLPHNPTPAEVHVRLLTLMGWRHQRGESPTYGGLYKLDGWFDPHDEWHDSIPPLDDTLLRLARERLLTTHELWEAYLWEVCAQLGVSIAIMWSIVGYQTIMDSPILTHAIAICRAVEKGEA